MFLSFEESAKKYNSAEFKAMEDDINALKKEVNESEKSYKFKLALIKKCDSHTAVMKRNKAEAGKCSSLTQELLFALLLWHLCHSLFYSCSLL